MAMRIDRSKFFARVRPMFGGKLRQGVVDNLNAILETCDAEGITKTVHVAYILATAYGEVYSTKKNPDMDPVREGFAKTEAAARAAVANLFSRGKIKRNYALPHHGHSWYGRGYVQCTHYDNYLRMEEELGLPLTQNPDLALDPKVAALIMVRGMRKGIFTGRDLDDYLPGSYVHARRIINGSDRATKFADHARKFGSAIFWEPVIARPETIVVAVTPGATVEEVRDAMKDAVIGQAGVPVLDAHPVWPPLPVAKPPEQAYNLTTWERFKLWVGSFYG